MPEPRRNVFTRLPNSFRNGVFTPQTLGQCILIGHALIDTFIAREQGYSNNENNNSRHRTVPITLDIRHQRKRRARPSHLQGNRKYGMEHCK